MPISDAQTSVGSGGHRCSRVARLRVSPSVADLVTVRGLQGVGGGGMTVLSFTAVADLLSPGGRGKHLGLFGAVFGLASILGPLIGGALTQAA